LHTSEILGAKIVQNLAHFGQLWTSIANIFGTDQDIDKQKTALSATISPTLDKKIGVLRFTNNTVLVSNVYHPKSTVHVISDNSSL